MKSKREEKIHALEMKGGINVRNKLQRRRGKDGKRWRGLGSLRIVPTPVTQIPVRRGDKPSCCRC